jgi:hypothetical protein
MTVFMNTVKHHKVCLDVLGLGRRDRSNWLNEWTPMEQSDTEIIGTGVNLILGDLLQHYPGMNIMSLLVKSQVTSPSTKPILLRVSLGIDSRIGTQDCNYCDFGFLVFDYLGPEGAIKIHDSFSKRNLHQVFRDVADYKNTSRLVTKSLKLKWSESAPMYKGWAQMPVMRACLHGETVVYHEDEPPRTQGDDKWTGSEDSDHTSFQAFPLDSSVRIYDISCHHSGGNKERGFEHAKWNEFSSDEKEVKFDSKPKLEDQFNPYPSDDEKSLDEFCFDPSCWR